MTIAPFINIGQCCEGDTIRFENQEWRVGPVESGERVIYGITRRSIRSLPSFILVERLTAAD